MRKDLISLISFYIVCIGFSCSVICNLLTYFGIDPEWHFSIVSFLPVLCIIMALVAFRNSNKFQDFLDYFFDDPGVAPLWLKVGCAWLLFYVIFNFIFSISKLDGGNPNIVKGIYVLSSHGSILKKLTFEEYYKYQSYEVRLYSGHSIIFFLLEMLFFYPKSPKITSDSLKPVS